MATNKKTVEDLIAEQEGPPPTPARTSPSSGSRWLLPFALLTLGFGAGWFAAGQQLQSPGATATKPGKESRKDLLAAGWQESAQGVFTRRCQDNCRRPVIYGGGLADVIEVNCLERPCGEIQVGFVVLDSRGQMIDEIMQRGTGRQGERLQLVIESKHPEAQRLVLQSFSAVARLE